MILSLLRRAPRSRPMPAGIDEAAAHLEPEDVEIVHSLPQRPWPFLWDILRRRYAGHIVMMAGLIVLGQTIEAFEPWVMRQMINGLAAASRGEPAEPHGVPLHGWFAVLVAIWLGGNMMYRLYQVVDIGLSPSLRRSIQARLLGYVLGHSPRYFQDNFAGKLGQKIKRAGQASLGLIEVAMFEMLRTLVLLCVAGALLVGASPFYAAILAVWTALYLGIAFLLARRCIGLSSALSTESSTSSGRLVDVIANADVVRAFARSAHERRLLGRFLDRERAASRRLRWFLLLMRMYQLVGIVVLLGIILWFAMQETLAGSMDVGGFTMVFALGGLIAQTVWTLSNRMLDFFEMLGDVSEALDLVTAPHEIVDLPGAKPLAVTRGAIRIRGLRFAYADGTPIFDGLDLDVAPGEKIGLVGQSGAGKSTLVRLIRRQALPLAGSIEIDGQDVTRVTWDSLNEAIAEVPQQPGVFHRSIRDNIRYACPDATDDAVIAAAKDAHAHDFIMRRPMGYDTLVGEQGVKLSGGERQRIAIARALLKDAPILVLDEATSALDSESEHLIQEALWTLMAGRTVIAIAHRLSTITGLDRIIVLDQGRILEQGSHAELLARNGAYARLWTRQVGGFLEVG